MQIQSPSSSIVDHFKGIGKDIKEMFNTGVHDTESKLNAFSDRVNTLLSQGDDQLNEVIGDLREEKGQLDEEISKLSNDFKNDCQNWDLATRNEAQNKLEALQHRSEELQNKLDR